jgi:hypothetical protein
VFTSVNPYKSIARASIVAVAICACSGDTSSGSRVAYAANGVGVPAEAATAVLVGAGDIAACGSNGAAATARLLAATPGTIFTVGDNAYGSSRNNRPMTCFAATWGRFKDRTRPAIGNHEYEERYLDSYFAYFGKAAGERGKGYYSYDLGGWHVVVLNTMIATDPSSPQGRWLAADLRAHPALCTLAYFHHPRFSSGPHHTSGSAVAAWNALSRAGADVVVAGHDHIYERFAPMSANGSLDRARGIREFIVGTGGASHYPFARSAANSEVRNNDTFGVLRLTLYPSGYAWKFLPAAGSRFSDSGAGRCHAV